MKEESHVLDVRWRFFATKHKMEEYRHGLGLLRGCFRQFGDERFAISERTFGIQFVLTAARCGTLAALWADEGFLRWCRLPSQVRDAEAAWETARKLGLIRSSFDESRMRPHRSVDAPLLDSSSKHVRFRWLAGSREVTALADMTLLEDIPETVLLDSENGRIMMHFPLIDDPSVPLRSVARIWDLPVFN